MNSIHRIIQSQLERERWVKELFGEAKPMSKRMSNEALAEIRSDLDAALKGDEGALKCLEAIATEIASRMLYLEEHVDDLVGRLRSEEKKVVSLRSDADGKLASLYNENQRLAFELKEFTAYREQTAQIVKDREALKARVTALEYALNSKKRGAVKGVIARDDAEERIETKIQAAEGH